MKEGKEAPRAGLACRFVLSPVVGRIEFRVGIHVGDVGRGRADCCEAVARAALLAGKLLIWRA
jgi:hypothetical protein